ncbi:hypothetical protein BSL82_00200 [Tardibacter chloracetimidivorans]|uniref:Anti-sigma factor n=1 Tax=Tardibacter chloracetimidivorans TaxID=1921510 RepID=A0A1L3ZQL7_9SPHN|nr:hypothetical protein [Tardibacter chloracetimidivorans]API57915.1 hypothetical protein BSL82_00200 [Tardibacter chloracetimidivorans]
MKIDEETLMAFADGQLSGAQAEAVAAAVAGDPVLAEKVAQHRQLRETMAAAFAPVLDEPVPPSLAAAVSAGAEDTPGKVVDFAVERRSRAIRRTPFIQRWGSIAAALVVGLFAGQLVDLPGGGGNLVKGSDGNLVASGELAAALDSQLASDNPQALGSPVRIGLTFAGDDGYCRTFLAVRADSLSGIACRQDGEWRLRMTTTPDGQRADAPDYRMAGADDVIMQSAQALMRDDPLDSAAEQRARAGGWETAR